MNKKIMRSVVVVALAAATAFTGSAASMAAGVDAKAAALVPAAVKSAGTLTIGVDATYAPNEYKDKAGNAIGWDVDLFNAVAAKLGLKTKWVVSLFDNIIPGIAGGKYSIGVSSFTDTKEREKKVDFVDYYNAGIQWAAASGKKVDPNNACGLIVAVETGTTEVDDTNAKSAACVKAGKKAITVLKFDTQDQVNAAVMLGRANAFSADSPVTEGAVAASKGKLTLAGAIYASALYGVALPKGSGLSKALSAALVDIYKDGTYGKILTKWGVNAGGVTSFGSNGATA